MGMGLEVGILVGGVLVAGSKLIIWQKQFMLVYLIGLLIRSTDLLDKISIPRCKLEFLDIYGFECFRNNSFEQLLNLWTTKMF